MRVAETRAVNAPSQSHGIGICSVEEIGSSAETVPPSRESMNFPPHRLICPRAGKIAIDGGPKVPTPLLEQADLAAAVSERNYYAKPERLVPTRARFRGVQHASRCEIAP